MTGRVASVVINPETGQVITVNPRSGGSGDLGSGGGNSCGP